MSMITGRRATHSIVPSGRDDPLREEFGWSEVATGLSRILLAYLVGVLGIGLGVGLLVAGALGRELKLFATNVRETSELFVFFGTGIVVISGLISYGMILAAKRRCVLGAPERHGAKWLIFACILCLLLGPAISFLTSLSGEGSQNYKAMRNGKEGIAELQFTSAGSIAQLASFVVSTASEVFFILFLRAVARCFSNEFCTWFATLYLIFTCLLLGGTVQVVMLIRDSVTLHPQALIGLGLAWLLNGVFYIVLILLTRVCIGNGLSKIRSPLAAA
jgi:hypothetical protein